MRANAFLDGQRCPRCKRSHGELAVEKILEDNCVPYVSEYSFPGSRYRYDFAMFGSSGGRGNPDSHEHSDRHDDSINTSERHCKPRRDDKPVLLIEFDGRQHFEPVETFGGDDAFKETQKRDRAKNRLAEKHNVPLLRIRYDQFNLEELRGRKQLEKHLLECF